MAAKKGQKEDTNQSVEQLQDVNQQPVFIDTSSMSLEALVALNEKISRDIETQKAKRIADFKKEVKEKASALGVSVEEIFSIASASSPVTAVDSTRKRARRSDAGMKQEPYYFNPSNPEQTAFKKGLKPAWLKALIAQGVDIESLKIK